MFLLLLFAQLALSSIQSLGFEEYRRSNLKIKRPDIESQLKRLNGEILKHHEKFMKESKNLLLTSKKLGICNDQSRLTQMMNRMKENNIILSQLIDQLFAIDEEEMNFEGNSKSQNNSANKQYFDFETKLILIKSLFELSISFYKEIIKNFKSYSPVKFQISKQAESLIHSISLIHTNIKSRSYEDLNFAGTSSINIDSIKFKLIASEFNDEILFNSICHDGNSGVLVLFSQESQDFLGATDLNNDNGMFLDFQFKEFCSENTGCYHRFARYSTFTKKMILCLKGLSNPSVFRIFNEDYRTVSEIKQFPNKAGIFSEILDINCYMDSFYCLSYYEYGVVIKRYSLSSSENYNEIKLFNYDMNTGKSSPLKSANNFAIANDLIYVLCNVESKPSILIYNLEGKFLNKFTPNTNVRIYNICATSNYCFIHSSNGIYVMEVNHGKFFELSYKISYIEDSDKPYEEQLIYSRDMFYHDKKLCILSHEGLLSVYQLNFN